MYYIANQASDESPGHTASAIDAAPYRVIGTVKSASAVPGAVATDDGPFAYLANSAAVSAIDVNTIKVLHPYRAGGWPNGITVR